MPFAGAGAAAAGLAAAPEVFGLNKSPRLNLPGEGDGAGCVAGAGVALAFFIARCFAGVCDGEGDSAGLGDCACEIQMQANPTRAMRARNLCDHKRERKKADGLQSIQFRRHTQRSRP